MSERIRAAVESGKLRKPMILTALGLAAAGSAGACGYSIAASVKLRDVQGVDSVKTFSTMSAVMSALVAAGSLGALVYVAVKK